MTLLQSSSSGSILFDDCDILQPPERNTLCIGLFTAGFSLFEKLKTWEFLDYGAGLAESGESGNPGGGSGRTTAEGRAVRGS